MNAARTTFRRELASYLFSPIGYVIGFLLYLFRGFEVDRLVRFANAAGLDREQFAAAYLQQPSSLILLILVPAILTMRCFAEERRTGSIEVLLTAPVRDSEIVLGKWAAAFVFFALLWLPAAVILVVAQGSGYLGLDLAVGPTVSGFVGLLLVGALLLAAGCLTSSLTDNTLLASLSSMLFALALIYGPTRLQGMTEVDPAVESDLAWWAWLQTKVLDPVVGQVHVVDHLQSWFFRGLLNTGHVVFYVAGTALLLFLTTRSLEARRWR
ncbi:MAG: ABC transporter permease [Planctomycetota bacterium]|jgi:ABC-2 type transport system permease protein